MTTFTAISHILDYHTLPSDDEELADHGQERLEVLVATFGGESIDGKECTSEWECLKNTKSQQLFIHVPVANVATPLYGSVIAGHVPSTKELSTIAPLIPVSTAECKSSFFAMNRIKTKLRNHLKISTLD